MPRPAALLKRLLIFIHRWLGVGLSVLFALWFLSGIVIMYWSFPSVTQRDRLARAPVLDPAEIKFSPQEAYAALDSDWPATQAQLVMVDGRPAYRFGGGFRGFGRGEGGTIVYADDGKVRSDITDAMLDAAASAWARRPLSEAQKEAVEEVDQWTVGLNFRALRPLYKYSFPDGRQVYVSGRSGEVVQYTTRSSRFWAYLGAIPHWLYFTPLRKHPVEWTKFVVWSSSIAAFAALIGLVIALWMLSPSKRYRHAGMPTSIPYRGWKRWHTILGLFFGLVTTTWAFSGMLSMGPFPNFERMANNARDWLTGKNATTGGEGQELDIYTALSGDRRFQLADYAARHPRDAIALVSGHFQPRQLEFTTFAGEPVYLAYDAGGRTRIIPLDGPPKEQFDSDRIMSLVQQEAEAAGVRLAELRLIDEYDAYYLDRRGERPLPVVYARVNDEANTRYYIDPRTGRVVGDYSSRNWVNRWLYHGLHSLDFPWLYKRRPLWDFVVITLMLGGTGICVTSLVLAWRVLRRKMAALLRARIEQPSEDLALETTGPLV